MRASSKPRTTAGVSSSDALSETSSTKSSYVCASTLRIDCASHSARLRVGMQTVTRGPVAGSAIFLAPIVATVVDRPVGRDHALGGEALGVQAPTLLAHAGALPTVAQQVGDRPRDGHRVARDH